MWEGWGLTLKNLFLPTFCKQCDNRLLTEENGYFCPTCWEISPRITRPFCTLCGKPHQGTVGFGSQSNFPCADCREKKSHPVRRTYGAAIYADAIREAIRLFKFHDRPRLTKPLSQLMIDFAQQEMDLDRYDLLIPVPLHPIRERERGFNQSYLLAAAIQPTFPNATLDGSLRRIRPTPVQSRSAGPSERRENVRGAFAVFGDTVKGKTVLLIDDVVTTGGTTAECALALHRANVAEVDVLAAALAVTPPVSRVANTSRRRDKTTR